MYLPSAPSKNDTGDPLYAIGFNLDACGKTIRSSKRRLRWRFGLANPEALAEGKTGAACRGIEHDITLVWSVTSGKVLIIADEEEVHFSKSNHYNHTSVFEHSWETAGKNKKGKSHKYRILVHASTSFMDAKPGLRQYDFFVDGRSYYKFPRVSRLGGSRAAPVDLQVRSPRENHVTAETGSRRKTPSESGSLRANSDMGQQDEYLRETAKATLDPAETAGAPSRRRLSVQASQLLIDFFDDFDTPGNIQPPAPSPTAGWAAAPAGPPPPAPMAPPPPTPTHDQFAAPTNPFAAAPAAQPTPVAADPFGFDAPAYQQQPGTAPQRAPVPIAVDPFAAQAQAYGQPPQASPLPVASDPFAPQAPSYGQPPQADPMALYTEAASAQTPLTIDPFASPTPADAAQTQTAGPADADKALQNLMGSIDSFGITGSAAQPPSNAHNPFGSSSTTSNATLGEIKKNVMNASPAQGAMVMANNKGGNWGGYGGVQQQQQGAPQYTMAGGYGQGAQQQPHMGGYGQQQQPMQSPMGMAQQPMMGQQPPMQQQGDGTPQNGQTPPMQQNPWGASS